MMCFLHAASTLVLELQSCYSQITANCMEFRSFSSIFNYDSLISSKLAKQVKMGVITMDITMNYSKISINPTLKSTHIRHLSQAQKKFMLVVIHFTKWVKTKPLATITTQQVQKFMWKIICYLVLTCTVITYNGREFINKKLVEFYKNWASSHHQLSQESQMKGQVEAINKTIVAEVKQHLGQAKGA